MRRPSRSAFVVTVSALTACASPQNPTPKEHTPVHTPPAAPAPEPQPEEPAAITEPPPDAASPTPDESPRLSNYPTTLNPRDAQNRVIKRMWQGDQCFVELPFPPLGPGSIRPPGSAPPSKTLPCPAAMLGPPYEQCRGGVIHGKSDGSACICFVMGNPPPPPRSIDCPKP